MDLKIKTLRNFCFLKEKYERQKKKMNSRISDPHRTNHVNTLSTLELVWSSNPATGPNWSRRDLKKKKKISS